MREGTVRAPGFDDHFGAFAIARVALAFVEAHDVVVVFQYSAPDRVFQPAAADYVEHRVLFGQAYRMIERDQRYAGAQPDTPGARRRRRCDYRRRAKGVSARVMFAEP